MFFIQYSDVLKELELLDNIEMTWNSSSIFKTIFGIHLSTQIYMKQSPTPAIFLRQLRQFKYRYIIDQL